MNDFISGVARAAIETFDAPAPVLEVGSYLVDGQEEIADLRQFLPGKEFIGIDMRKGPGVDSVENVQNLPRSNDSFGTVIALNVFEHVEKFWIGFEEMQRVMRPDGMLVVSCPFYFHIHDYPSDYWRFTPEALNSLMSDTPTKILGWHGAENRPSSVWAVGFGRDYREITESDREAFHNKIAEYSHEPMKLSRKIRYRIGKLLCGKAPFEPFLDMEKFTTQIVRMHVNEEALKEAA